MGIVHEPIAGMPSPGLVPPRHDDGLDWHLLNDFQRDFPLQTRPFARIARALGCDEATVRERLASLQSRGAVSRVGPVFAPRRVGASTLAALRVPPSHLAEVAAVVSASAAVNHNYARDHAWNLWFVATAADMVALARGLREIRRATACPMIELPLLTEYHIDLGFDLASGARVRSAALTVPSTLAVLDAEKKALMAVIERGIPLTARPFHSVGRRAGLGEAAVLAQLRAWLADGTLKRFGVVVRHHELGWRANAMCVWDVPDDDADRLGLQLAACDGVNLCYRRRRAGSRWRFNLYCMLHGRDRAEVLQRLRLIRVQCGLVPFPHEVLFSTHRYKQRGASYADRRHD